MHTSSDHKRSTPAGNAMLTVAAILSVLSCGFVAYSLSLLVINEGGPILGSVIALGFTLVLAHAVFTFIREMIAVDRGEELPRGNPLTPLLNRFWPLDDSKGNRSASL